MDPIINLKSDDRVHNPDSQSKTTMNYLKATKPGVQKNLHDIRFKKKKKKNHFELESLVLVEHPYPDRLLLHTCKLKFTLRAQNTTTETGSTNNHRFAREKSKTPI